MSTLVVAVVGTQNPTGKSDTPDRSGSTVASAAPGQGVGCSASPSVLAQG